MAKAHIQTSPLFIDGFNARVVSEDILAALVKVRAAKRAVCKAESKRGQQAHQDLHAAEAALERVLAALGASEDLH